MPMATAAHTAPTGPVWGFAGVLFPYPDLKTAHSASQAEFRFCVQNEIPLPLKGEGYLLSWVGRVCPARSKLGHAGPTGPVWGCAGVVSPTRPPKPHTGAHRGEVGFTAFSWCASFAAVPPAAAPDGNSPPRGWARSCKAASRFSRFRPMSTR